MKISTFKEWTLREFGGVYLLKCVDDEEGEEKLYMTKEQLESLKEFMLGLGAFAEVGKEEK
jgi:hypothetical protein